MIKSTKVPVGSRVYQTPQDGVSNLGRCLNQPDTHGTQPDGTFLPHFPRTKTNKVAFTPDDRCCNMTENKIRKRAS